MKIVVTEKTKTAPAPTIIVRVKTWPPNRAPQWDAPVGRQVMRADYHATLLGELGVGAPDTLLTRLSVAYWVARRSLWSLWSR